MKICPLKSTAKRIIPDKLIYKHSCAPDYCPTQEIFSMFSTRGSMKSGELKCHKAYTMYRNDYDGPILVIDLIKSDQPNSGIGKSLIDFAKNYSRKNGCNGYICLLADCCFTPNRVPHIFYRKCGFSTLDKEIDNKLDKFIKNNKDATHKDFSRSLMFYPKIEYKKTFFEKLSDLFKFT